MLFAGDSLLLPLEVVYLNGALPPLDDIRVGWLEHGAFVHSVAPHGPASSAGVCCEDRLVLVDGAPFTSLRQLSRSPCLLKFLRVRLAASDRASVHDVEEGFAHGWLVRELALHRCLPRSVAASLCPAVCELCVRLECVPLPRLCGSCVFAGAPPSPAIVGVALDLFRQYEERARGFRIRSAVLAEVTFDVPSQSSAMNGATDFGLPVCSNSILFGDRSIAVLSHLTANFDALDILPTRLAHLELPSGASLAWCPEMPAWLAEEQEAWRYDGYLCVHVDAHTPEDSECAFSNLCLFPLEVRKLGSDFATCYQPPEAVGCRSLTSPGWVLPFPHGSPLAAQVRSGRPHRKSGSRTCERH